MNDQELFKCILKIQTMAYDYASENVRNEPWLQNRHTSEVNPFYHQTQSGIFLELYCGMPGKLWTPWGEWTC